MKYGFLVGLLVSLVMLVVAREFWGNSQMAWGQQRSSPSTTDTVVVAVPATGGGQFVVVVDTANKVMGSYHVNADNGHISLRSVRNYQWDLRMSDFNGAEPKPNEVRSLIEQR